jgi:hypothetical protein
LDWDGKIDRDIRHDVGYIFVCVRIMLVGKLRKVK